MSKETEERFYPSTFPPSTGKRIMSDTSGLDEIRILRENEYDRRVEALEDEGLTRSDAQGVVDAENLKKEAVAIDGLYRESTITTIFKGEFVQVDMVDETIELTVQDNVYSRSESLELLDELQKACAVSKSHTELS